MIELILDVPTAVAVVIRGGVVLLCTAVFFLAAARLLSRDLSELGSVPLDLLTHRLGQAVLAWTAVTVLFSILIPIGLLLFLIPGLFLIISFNFAVYAIAVEDSGPIEALKRSRELETGNRWQLFGLSLFVAAAGVIGAAIGSVVSFISPISGELLSLVFSSVYPILAWGIFADVFVQLRESSDCNVSSVYRERSF